MPTRRYRVRINERSYEVEIAGDGGETRARLAQSTASADVAALIGQHLMSVLFDGRSEQALVLAARDNVMVVLRGVAYSAEVLDERAARLASLAPRTRAPGGSRLDAPMPGLVVQVLAKAGDTVQHGQPLVVLQAMKMENELTAPRSGTVKQVDVRAGQTVEHGQSLMVLE